MAQANQNTTTDFDIAAPIFNAVDDLGDSLDTPFPDDVAEWLVGRTGVQINVR
jgi:hypothetical protein